MYNVQVSLRRLFHFAFSSEKMECKNLTLEALLDCLIENIHCSGLPFFVQFPLITWSIFRPNSSISHGNLAYYRVGLLYSRRAHKVIPVISGGNGYKVRYYYYYYSRGPCATWMFRLAFKQSPHSVKWTHLSSMQLFLTLTTGYHLKMPRKLVKNPLKDAVNVTRVSDATWCQSINQSINSYWAGQISPAEAVCLFHFWESEITKF